MNGWRDIGYHFGIELVGSSYEILMGRMPDVQGAHVSGQNGDTIGICFVGNYDEIEPPKLMIEKGLELVKWLRWNYKILRTDVYPHSEFSQKTCPGRLFDVPRFVGAL